jgi:predicted metal-dependent hydrolase
LVISDEAVRLAVIDKLGWIKRQKAKFAAQPRQSQREMVNGESHYFMGRRYRLRVVEGSGAGRIVLRKTIMELHGRPDASPAQREAVLQAWYREQLKARIPAMLEKWQPLLGVQVADWRIKKMKTKWGSCSIDARRIWLNLELAKKSPKCLEYIVVHEMVHLLVRQHDDRFVAEMDRVLPSWQTSRAELNRSPLGHEVW